MGKGEIKAVRAEALGVSRKNIYRHPKTPVKDKQLVGEIKAAFIRHPSYGQYKMALHLGINHKRAERVMRENNLKAPRRKTKYYCTVPTYHHTYANLIKFLGPKSFTPGFIWVCDVSYFKFQGEFWYLATIEDLATRQILSAQVGKHHDATLILSAIKQAKLLTGRMPTYFHSDQGTEFMAEVVTGYLELQGVKISVSAKASPWENGYEESFFGHFKREFGEVNRFETAGQLIEEIYHQVHYYNFERIHRSLKMPPVVYAKLRFPE